MQELGALDRRKRPPPCSGNVRADVPLTRLFKANTVLVPEQVPHATVFVVCGGVVGLQHILGDGRRTLSTLYLDGDVVDFGELGDTSGTLICLRSVSGYLISDEEFDRRKRTDHEFCASLETNYARQNRFMARHCADLAHKSSVEKLASYIFECRSRQRFASGRDIHLILRRIDIADYMGLRAETLSRTFSQLKQLGLIDVRSASRVRIINEPVLRQIANGSVSTLACQ